VDPVSESGTDRDRELREMVQLQEEGNDMSPEDARIELGERQAFRYTQGGISKKE
jgi:hypothetical protein